MLAVLDPDALLNTPLGGVVIGALLAAVFSAFFTGLANRRAAARTKRQIDRERDGLGRGILEELAANTRWLHLQLEALRSRKRVPYEGFEFEAWDSCSVPFLERTGSDRRQTANFPRFYGRLRKIEAIFERASLEYHASMGRFVGEFNVDAAWLEDEIATVALIGNALIREYGWEIDAAVAASDFKRVVALGEEIERGETGLAKHTKSARPQVAPHMASSREQVGGELIRLATTAFLAVSVVELGQVLSLSYVDDALQQAVFAFAFGIPTLFVCLAVQLTVHLRPEVVSPDRHLAIAIPFGGAMAVLGLLDIFNHFSPAHLQLGIVPASLANYFSAISVSMVFFAMILVAGLYLWWFFAVHSTDRQSVP